MSVKEIAQKAADMCREGKNMEVVNELYAADIESIESAPWGDMPRKMDGLEAVKGKNEWWFANNELHSGDVQGPFIHGDDRFALMFVFDITPKGGERVTMTEIGIYTVVDGKIKREEFYNTPEG